MTENETNAKYYGLGDCLRQTQEEAAELIQAISKYHRAIGHGMPTVLTEDVARSQILEEIADVRIMIEQLQFFLDPAGEEIRRIYEFKVRRTTERRQQNVCRTE